MTPEELQQYMDSIPEWKRGALVVVENDKEDEEVQGLFGKIKGKLGDKFKDSSVGK
jgi:hypothetical protein